MKPIISAVAIALLLSGTAFAQQRGADRQAAQSHDTMRAQMNRANGIVAQVNEAYGTHFLITEVAPQASADVTESDGQIGDTSTAQPSNPHTSWQFGPWVGRYPNGE